MLSHITRHKATAIVNDNQLIYAHKVRVRQVATAIMYKAVMAYVYVLRIAEPTVM